MATRKKAEKEARKLVNHTVPTRSERTFERHARNKDGEIVRRTDTVQVTAQLQTIDGGVFRNGARIA